MLYTKGLGLEQISLQDYRRRKTSWEFHKETRPNDVFASIKNPVFETDYEKLIHRLLDHPNAYKLRVRANGFWIKRNPHRHKVSDGDIRGLAAIAAKDRFKKNYLEIGFKVDTDIWASAEIEFIERNGIIIGYRVSVPNLDDLINLFDYRGTLPIGFGYIEGLADPQQFRA